MTSAVTYSANSRSSQIGVPLKSVKNVKGRTWTSLCTAVAKIGLTLCATLASIICVAALIAGIVGLMNPIGFGLLSAAAATFITTAFSFIAENAIVVVIAGAVGIALIGLTILIMKKCRSD